MRWTPTEQKVHDDYRGSHEMKWKLQITGNGNGSWSANHCRCCSAPFDIRLFDRSALGLCESNLNSITLGHTRNMASRMRKTGTKKAALFAKSTAPALELHDIRSAKKVNFGGFLCLPRGFPESTSTTGIAPIAILGHMNRFDHVLIGFQLELCTWGPAGCSRRICCPFLESN